MNKILSVSIAAYNVESVIPTCLDSFTQAKCLDDIEVLVVNDGSKDHTVDVVNGYVEKYPQSIILIDKPNGGHGSTINAALNRATGKYFKVVDGDDWVDPEALDSLVEFLKTTDVDLVLNNYMSVYPDHKKLEDIVGEYELNKVYDFDKNLQVPYIPMHSTTVLLSTYKKVGKKISEHRFYVDTEYVFFVGICAQSVVYRPECVYQYRLGSEGQSVSPTGIYKHIEDLVFVEERLISIYSEVDKKLPDGNRKNYLFYIIDSRYNLIFHWFTILEDSSKDVLLEEFDKKMRKDYPQYVKLFDIGRKKIIRYNYPLMTKFVRMYLKHLK